MCVGVSCRGERTRVLLVGEAATRSAPRSSAPRSNSHLCVHGFCRLPAQGMRQHDHSHQECEEPVHCRRE
jgi:hypothetical protein